MGIVRRIEPFGAYVSIADGVYGVLKNVDITDGLGTEEEALKIGQTVSVLYKGESSNGTIYLKLAEEDKQ